MTAIARRKASVLLLLLKGAVTIALFAAIVYWVDIEKAWASISILSVEPLVGLVLMIVALGLFQTLRWQLVLKALDLKLGYRQLLHLVFVSIGVMQVIPGTVGADALRIAGLMRQGVGFQPAFDSCAFDRLCAVLALVSLTILGAPFLTQFGGSNQLLFGTAACVALAIAGLLVLRLLSILPSRFRSIRTVRALSLTATSVLALLGNKSLLLKSMALSAMIQLGFVSTVYWIFLLMNVQVGFAECMLIMPPILLLSMIPVSIAGWGVRDGAMLAAFALVHVDSASALAASVLYGALITAAALVSLALGVILAFGNAEA